MNDQIFEIVVDGWCAIDPAAPPLVVFSELPKLDEGGRVHVRPYAHTHDRKMNEQYLAVLAFVPKRKTSDADMRAIGLISVSSLGSDSVSEWIVKTDYKIIWPEVLRRKAS